MVRANRFSDLEQALKERIEALCRDLDLGQPTYLTAEEWRFGRKGSLSIVICGEKRGQFFDHEAGVGGGPIGLIAHLRGLSFAEAARWASDWTGFGVRPTPSPRRARSQQLCSEKAPVPQINQQMAAQIWESAIPISGTPGEAYLIRRCGGLPTHDLSHVLRFHPDTKTDGKALPALIARMTDPVTGGFRGVHRTFLTPDGHKHPIGKRMLGHKGVIRLWPDEDVTMGLIIAEGIETALAGAHLYGLQPVWACGDAGNLAKFPVLSGIEGITVIADNDPSGVGERAAQGAIHRWCSARRFARLIMRRARGDMADFIEENRYAA